MFARTAARRVPLLAWGMQRRTCSFHVPKLQGRWLSTGSKREMMYAQARATLNGTEAPRGATVNVGYIQEKGSIRPDSNPDLPKLEFGTSSITLLDQVQNGAEQLVPQNPSMTITRAASKLVIQDGDNQFNISIDEVVQRITYFTNVGETNATYHLDELGEWRNTQDGHHLKGIIVRDFLRTVNGLLEL